MTKYCAAYPEHADLLRSFFAKHTESFTNAPNSTVSLAPRTPSAASTPLPEGPVGRYQLEEVLGRGGFGMVWRATDPELHRAVAVKILRSDRAAGPAAQQALLAEARKIAKLNHPAILKVYDVLREGDGVYVVSEWMPRGALAGHMSEFRGRWQEIASLVVSIAEALHYAHLHGVVHRDIKPHNILLDEHGLPRLADFGLAVTEDEQLSESRGTLGTFAYMSPEAARGDSQYADPRADIYSLGIVLYELLTGRLPYVAHTPQQWIEQTLEREPRPPRTIDDQIPPELERICLKCLAKNLGDRYATAHDLADELEASVPKPQPVPRRGAGIAAAVAIAAVVVTLWGLWIGGFFKGEDTPAVASTTASAPATNTAPEVADAPRAPQAELDEDPPQPDVWTQVLRRPPLKLLWTKNTQTSIFLHQPEEKLLHVVSPSIGLLELGHTDRPALGLRSMIFQPNWEGGAGMFFGYREDDEHSPTRIRFQTVTVEQKKHQDLPHLVIYRNYYEGDITGYMRTQRHIPLSDPLAISQQPRTLDLRVEGSKVTIRWGDDTALEAPTAAVQELQPEDYQGKFGLIAEQSSAVFSNVKVLFPGKITDERRERQQDPD